MSAFRPVGPVSRTLRTRRRAARPAGRLLVPALLGALLWPAAVAAPEPARLVFFVRHAEKGTDDPKDPTLTDAGRRRAEALADLLSVAGVTHLFSSEYRRTRETLAPLAGRTGLEVKVVAAADAGPQVEALRALPPGAVAVVAGHSNTVPALVESLGGTLADVKDSEYGRIFVEDRFDRLFLMVLPPGKDASAARTLELRYGD